MLDLFCRACCIIRGGSRLIDDGRFIFSFFLHHWRLVFFRLVRVRLAIIDDSFLVVLICRLVFCLLLGYLRQVLLRRVNILVICILLIFLVFTVITATLGAYILQKGGYGILRRSLLHVLVIFFAQVNVIIFVFLITDRFLWSIIFTIVIFFVNFRFL